MEKIRILHITDLHIDNPNSTNENLRKGFFMQYIKGLVKTIKEEFQNVKLDYLVLSGDYINKGNKTSTSISDKFKHAKEITDFLLKELNLNINSVSTCIGNHDLIVDLEDIDKGRVDYKNYIESHFKFGKLIESNNYFSIYFDKSKDIYNISFDSTYNSNKKNQPGKLSEKELDNLRVKIHELIPEDKTLIINSHYPMIIFPETNLYLEEDNWIENHLWKSGSTIVDCLLVLRTKAPTLWFFGDSHIPDFRSIDNHTFIMTGMFGGDYINRTAENENGKVISFRKTNEVKIIELDVITSEVTINTLNYEPKGHHFQSQGGKWGCIKSHTRPTRNPFNVNKKENTIISEIEAENTNGIFEIISVSVEEQIMTEINSRKLYQFNRYQITETHSSLGWIQIHKLFQNKELMSRCYDKSLDWLEKNIGNEIENTLLIGIDFWGTIFSSYISVRKNIPNYCFATKFDGKHNTKFEKIEYINNKVKANANVTNIVIFTDVLSTGSTVKKVFNELINGLEDRKITFSVVSILSERVQKNRLDLAEFKFKGTLCSKLKIPVLNNEELPSYDILPPKYDMR